ncbi:hypothetical protein OL229_04570 [Neisseriaceae bacterium JH1-16]|nr:hypothetical protein [Neisseriaceae bacterium JH1-16]
MKQAVFFSLLMLGLPALAHALPSPAYANRVNGSTNLVTEHAEPPSPVRTAQPVEHQPHPTHHHRKPVRRRHH